MIQRTINLSPDEVLDILKERFRVKDARVQSLYGRGGLSWEGLSFLIYDKWEGHLEFMNKELNQLESEAFNALHCLYIAVEKDIADDVNNKVRAYISALKAEIPKQSDYFETSTAQES